MADTTRYEPLHALLREIGDNLTFEEGPQGLQMNATLRTHADYDHVLQVAQDASGGDMSDLQLDLTVAADAPDGFDSYQSSRATRSR